MIGASKPLLFYTSAIFIGLIWVLVFLNYKVLREMEENRDYAFARMVLVEKAAKSFYMVSTGAIVFTLFELPLGLFGAVDLWVMDVPDFYQFLGDYVYIGLIVFGSGLVYFFKNVLSAVSKD